MIPQIEYQTTGVSEQPHGLNQSGRMRWLAEHATPNGSTATNWPVVANTLGIDTSRIRLYLAGTTRITKRDAAAIADYFNVDLNWLRLDDPGSYHRLNHTNGVSFDNIPEATMADAKTQGKKLEMAKRQYEERIGYVRSWSQYGVELGINNSLISLYRRCIRRISKPHAQLLAKLFDVSAEWLRDTDERMFPRIGNQARPEILNVASAGDSQRHRLQHAKRAVEQRESRRLSWSQFAKFVGMSHASLSHNVNGTRRISDAWAAKISAATGINPVWLQTGEGTPIAAIVTRFNPTVIGPEHERLKIAKRLIEEKIKRTLTWDEIAQLCSNSKQTASQVTTDLMLQPSSGQIDGRIAFSIGSALGVNWIWLATGAGNPTDTNYQLSRTARLTQRWRLELAKDTYERESATAITWEAIAERASVGADHMEKLLGETRKFSDRAAFNIGLVLRVNHAWLQYGLDGLDSDVESLDRQQELNFESRLNRSKLAFEVRKGYPLTWRKIGAITHSEPNALISYSRGETLPPWRTTFVLAQLFEVNSIWLLFGIGKSSHTLEELGPSCESLATRIACARAYFDRHSGRCWSREELRGLTRGSWKDFRSWLDSTSQISERGAHRLGVLFGVSPRWLSTGEGSMLEFNEPKLSESSTLSEKMETARQRLELRSGKLITWTEMSRMVGIPANYLTQLKQSDISLARSVHLEKIANILQVTASWLVNGSYSKATMK